MWSPTHAQVVVQKARNLRVKGKHGANDVYVTIQLGKEKFQTSVQEKSVTPEWHEECELSIPQDDNKASIVLSVFHRSFVGLDKFLGRVDIPLQDLDIYERPKSRWYPLRGKPSKSDSKERGELEAKVAFIVKSMTGSLLDLSKKQKKTGSLPLKMVHSVGGSLMNLTGKDKRSSLGSPFKNLKNVGSKLSDKLPRRNRSFRSDQGSDRIDEDDVLEVDDMSQGDKGDFSDMDVVSDTSSTYAAENAYTINMPELGMDNEIISNNRLNDKVGGDLGPTSDFFIPMPVTPPNKSKQTTVKSDSRTKINVDPSKMSQDFSQPTIANTELPQHKISIKTSNVDISAAKSNINNVVPITNYSINVNEPIQKPQTRVNSARRQNVMSIKKNVSEEQTVSENQVNNLRENRLLAYVSQEKFQLFNSMTKQELVELICKQQYTIEKQQKQVKDLEDYIDNLLVRVMESTPRLLQNPFKTNLNMRNGSSKEEEKLKEHIQRCNYL